jgi:phage tail P2-like protein
MGKPVLPPNSSRLERATAQALALSAELGVPIDTLWDPHQCPAQQLPWLAWAVGVEEWSASWPEQVQRDVIAATPQIRRHRGTVWAVREALRAAGYADAYLEEGLPTLSYDGSELHNAEDDYSGGSRWALFRVIADIGEDRGVGGDELERLVRLIRRAKPVRSVLREIAYQASVTDEFVMQDHHQVQVHQVLDEVRPAGRRYDGSINHDQAERLPRAPQRFDGAAWHNGITRHDGLQPYYGWEVHGERHDNAWDHFSFGLGLDTADTHQAIALYDGRASHENALTHGAQQPPAVDAGLVAVTFRRRHNSRFTHNGARHYRGSAPDYHAI